jgi:hypothetical protein
VTGETEEILEKAAEMIRPVVGETEETKETEVILEKAAEMIRPAVVPTEVIPVVVPTKVIPVAAAKILKVTGKTVTERILRPDIRYVLQKVSAWSQDGMMSIRLQMAL